MKSFLDKVEKQLGMNKFRAKSSEINYILLEYEPEDDIQKETLDKARFD